MDFSLRKSFNARGSQKHFRKISAGGGDDSRHEEQPILFNQGDDYTMSPADSSDQREFIVKIDGGHHQRNNSSSNRDVAHSSKDDGSKLWRESSIAFWKDERENNNDDGSGEGIYFGKKKTSGEKSLDMNLELDEFQIQNDRNNDLTPVAKSPRELKVSFESPAVAVEVSSPESTRRRYKESSDDEDQYRRSHQQHERKASYLAAVAGGGSGEVLRCTSNKSFKRKSSLLRAKTKSRLMDPPEQPDRKSGRIPKSGPMKAGYLGKGLDCNDEEDDPFMEEDLPEEYKKVNLSALTVLQWLSLILIIAALICSLSIPTLRIQTLWRLKLWKWEVLVLVLICGRLVSGWGIRIVVFFVERNFLLRKKVLYFVYGVRKAVQNCLWLGLVLIAWHYLFDEKVERETKSQFLQYVTKILVCLLVGTLLWLVKTLMVKVLASSFHVSTFFDRIQDSLFNQYVIETLSGRPLIEIRNTQEEEERMMAEVQKLQNAGAAVPPDLRANAFPTVKSVRVIGSGRLTKSPIGKSFKFSGPISKKHDEGITIDHLHKLNHKNVSAWNMKRLMNIVRHGVLTTLDEQILDSAHDDESTTHIRSEVEAKAAAKKIFQNVAKHVSKYIYLEDLMRFMLEDEALKTLSLFEGASESKRICKSSLKSWVVNAFRERRALALTLNDTKTAVNKLHKMVNFVIGIIIGVIWLLILGIATSKLLALISSQLLLVAFIFGNTLKTIFEALIFLFVIHPFDVGDRCEIEGVQMVVEEMNILTTVFLRYDDQRIVYPNSVLATKFISNYYRSPDMGDGVEFCVHIATPTEKITVMKQRITAYIENKKEHWYPAPMIVLKDVEEFNRVRFAVWLKHRMNHQDMGERWARRGLLVEEMLKIFKELDIEYRLYPIDINVRAVPSAASTWLPPN